MTTEYENYTLILPEVIDTPGDIVETLISGLNSTFMSFSQESNEITISEMIIG